MQHIIDHYQFERIPIEGTLYKSTYVSKSQLESHPYATAIIGLYCNDPRSDSKFHRLQHDEVWHFYGGDPLVLHLLHPIGGYEKVFMSHQYSLGHKVQYVIPALTWQAGELLSGGNYALFGCTLSPGFTGSCFEGGSASQLIKYYPDQAQLINRLCIEGEQRKLPESFTR